MLGGLLLFWWLPRFLLGARAPRRGLVPGAVATMVALAGLRLFSRVVFAPLLVSNAVSYGTVGAVLVVQSWLIGVGFTVYGGSIVGWALAGGDRSAADDGGEGISGGRGTPASGEKPADEGGGAPGGTPPGETSD
ncbi:hypothetical protein [Kitasatospora sp. NPDC054795]